MKGDSVLRIEQILIFAEVSMVGLEHVVSNFPSEKQWLKAMVQLYQE